MAGRGKREEAGSRRPLFWDSKLYGKPHVEKVGGGERPAPGRRRTIEAVPGVRQEVEARAPSRAAQHAEGVDVASVEKRMRKQLTAKRELHNVERVVLLRAFAKVLRVPRVAAQQKVSAEQFAQVWRMLGVQLSPAEAAAFTNKYGKDREGLMPVMVFVDGLLVGAARYLVKNSEKVQRHNPYKAGEAATHTGEILYPQCRKGVFPPTDWDPRVAERSAEMPDIELRLDFIYGYSGLQNTAPNLFYVSPDEVIYYTAGVGIKYNKRLNSQCFFTQHDDDINCLAYCRERRLAASGQVGPVGRSLPKVYVWEPAIRRPDGTVDGEASRQEMPPLYELEFPKSDRGLVALAFSPKGQRLATVAMDNSHTMYIWDIGAKAKKKQRQLEDRGDALATIKTMQGAPPTTFGVVWSQFDDTTLLTYGLKYIKFYTLSEVSGKMEIKSSSGKFGNSKITAKQADRKGAVAVHTITAACFLSARSAITGNRDGELCTWRKLKSGGWSMAQVTPGHSTGSKQRCVDGSRNFSGVRVLRLRADGATLLSGGGDGLVLIWNVVNDCLEGPLRAVPVVLPDHLHPKEEPPKIVSLDCLPGSDIFMVGTMGCDIFEVDSTPEMLIEGHSADVYGLSMNPSHPHIFATAAESAKVGIWDISRRKNIRLVETARVARSVAWSPDGKQLAIGCRDGELQVLEFYPVMQQVFWARDSAGPIDELKFSPSGHALAVASRDQFIYVYSIDSKRFSLVGKCCGHSSAVIHLDWSKDGRVIQSSDTARELLYFSPITCKQVKENQRDTAWATWSTVQGFSVMGIWKNTNDTTDINACDRSPCERYLAAADDSGMVRLYNYPCVVEKAPSRDYKGHSSHVMNIRFSADGKYVASVGGHDRAVFQWRVCKPKKPSAPPVVAPWVHHGGNVWGPQPSSHPPLEQQVHRLQVSDRESPPQRGIDPDVGDAEVLGVEQHRRRSELQSEQRSSRPPHSGGRSYSTTPRGTPHQISQIQFG